MQPFSPKTMKILQIVILFCVAAISCRATTIQPPAECARNTHDDEAAAVRAAPPTDAAAPESEAVLVADGSGVEEGIAEAFPRLVLDSTWVVGVAFARDTGCPLMTYGSRVGTFRAGLDPETGMRLPFRERAAQTSGPEVATRVLLGGTLSAGVEVVLDSLDRS